MSEGFKISFVDTNSEEVFSSILSAYEGLKTDIEGSPIKVNSEFNGSPSTPTSPKKEGSTSAPQ